MNGSALRRATGEGRALARRRCAAWALALAVAPVAAAGEKPSPEEQLLQKQLDARSKQLEEQAKGWTLIARVPIKQRALYYVAPDGGLYPGVVQKPGKNPELHFSPGDVVRKVFVQGHHTGRVMLRVQCCRGGKRAWMPEIHILFPKPLKPEYLEPEPIMRGLSAFFDIQGYDPTAAVRGVVAALDAVPAAGLPSPAGPPTIAAVSVRVEPERVEPGGRVELVLEYEVSGAPGSAVVARERRTLRFGDQTLPGYPREESFPRAAGAHRTALSQIVPAAAATGSYELRGEVCIGDDCISRVARFEVWRPAR